MIVVDTSALLAIILDEPKAAACAVALQEATDLVMSAGTLQEAMIVASQKDFEVEMSELIERMAISVVDVTADSARRGAGYYRKWGKGFHPARLNYGDCFAYALAKERNCPLLYIGNDFERTDIESAIKSD